MDNKIKINLERKDFVLKAIREVLESFCFTEVSTSCIRKESHPMYNRFKADDLGYLRDAIEEPLKYLTQFKDRVYEIGNVFRREGSSQIKSLDDFLMLEFFAKNEKMDFVIKVLENIIKKIDPSITFRKISVAKIIKDDLNVDLKTKNGENDFINIIVGKKISDFKLFENIANKYIKYKVEPPRNSNDCIILFDYPLCTNCTAKQRIGSTIERFEMFVNGLEVAHGCQEEDNIELWKENAQKYGYYNSEEDFLYQSMKEGETPNKTSSLAMGIERLCMAIYKASNINEFYISFPPKR